MLTLAFIVISIFFLGWNVVLRSDRNYALKLLRIRKRDIKDLENQLAVRESKIQTLLDELLKESCKSHSATRFADAAAGQLRELIGEEAYQKFHAEQMQGAKLPKV